MRASTISLYSSILTFLLTLPATALPPSPAIPPTAPTPNNNPDSQPVAVQSKSTPEVIGTPNNLLPDPCGPPPGRPEGVPRGVNSTCYTNVTTSLPDDSPFKLNCSKDDTGYLISWNSCRTAVNAACALLTSATNPPTDQWIWAPTFDAKQTKIPAALHCTLGFWNPSHGALLPDTRRCRDDIWGRMIDGCGAQRDYANVASVNLKRLPHRTDTERDTGEAVEAGYPSYLIVAQNYAQQGVET